MINRQDRVRSLRPRIYGLVPERTFVLVELEVWQVCFDQIWREVRLPLAAALRNPTESAVFEAMEEIFDGQR